MSFPPPGKGAPRNPSRLDSLASVGGGVLRKTGSVRAGARRARLVAGQAGVAVSADQPGVAPSFRRVDDRVQHMDESVIQIPQSCKERNYVGYSLNEPTGTNR
ncbi:hypothetical protein DIPPA_06863 [Diplonema papillatum]|nr:hypothetical protein DIPPA_06863 [Diplonema papillatum]